MSKESYLKIQGRQSFQKELGEIELSGAKNAILPLLFASVLVPGDQKFSNVPALKDVEMALKMLQSLGLQHQWDGDCLLVKKPQALTSKGAVQRDSSFRASARAFRASVLILGPLLALTQRVKIPLPGGCQIGSRPINWHIEALKAMGAYVKIQKSEIIALAPKGLKGCFFRFPYPSVGASENLILAGVLAQGETYLENIACEPEVLSLIQYLKSRGAKIQRVKNRAVKIQGVKKLLPVSKPYAVIPDRIEAGTWLLLAAGLRGSLLIKKCQPSCLTALLDILRALDFKIASQTDQIFIKKSKHEKPGLFVKTGVYPAFPTDLQSQFMAFMTSLRGESVLEETVFEDRFRYVRQLNRLGAGIRIKDSSRAFIKGPVNLSGERLMATDLRAGAGLVIAALMAQGPSQLYGLQHIERGYENFVRKLKLLKAKVELVSPPTLLSEKNARKIIS